MVRNLSRAYHATPRSAWYRFRWYALGVAVLALTAAAIYSPLFRIRNIIIVNAASRPTEERLHELVSRQLAERRFLIFPQSNLFFFSLEEARAAVASEFYTDQLTVSRSLPGVIRVKLAQHLVVGVWEAGMPYAVDGRGVIVQELPADWQDDGTLVRLKPGGGEGLATPLLGDHVLPEPSIVFARQAWDIWQQQLPGRKLVDFTVAAKALPTLTATSEKGWQVLFSAEQDPFIQVVSAKRLLEEKLKDRLDKLEYLDVRFVSRLYYKLR